MCFVGRRRRRYLQYNNGYLVVPIVWRDNNTGYLIVLVCLLLSISTYVLCFPIVGGIIILAILLSLFVQNITVHLNLCNVFCREETKKIITIAVPIVGGI